MITAHPSGKPTQNANGSLDRPNQWNLSGGNMWNNKCDNILSINRPNYFQDMSDTSVDFHSLKIKKQKLVGIPGTVPMVYDRRCNRYFIGGQTALYDAFKTGETTEDKVPF